MRLLAFGAERTERFGEPVLTFRDPDGMRLALVGLPGIEAEPAWEASAKTAPAARGISANIKPRRKVAALFKAAAPRAVEPQAADEPRAAESDRQSN